MKTIRSVNTQSDTHLSVGNELGSGIRDAYHRIMGATPGHSTNCHLLKMIEINTPLGPMFAIADDVALYLLEFVDRRALQNEVKVLRKKTSAAIILGSSPPLISIERELRLYFEGKLKEFTTPLHCMGSPFSLKTWQSLRAIPYGETVSYMQLAQTIGRPTAYRAVARANGANQIAIVIPCHRVINHNGELGGYGGGLARKKWLLEHEKKY